MHNERCYRFRTFSSCHTSSVCYTLNNRCSIVLTDVSQCLANERVGWQVLKILCIFAYGYFISNSLRLTYIQFFFLRMYVYVLCVRFILFRVQVKCTRSEIYCTNPNLRSSIDRKHLKIGNGFDCKRI